jgi:sulfite exporter TauE/SafE
MLGGLTWALTGAVAGTSHVFAGPDHLAAIAPLAAHRRSGAWATGLMWGIGHSAGVWLVGGLALLVREAAPVDLLSEWSERLVGFVLIGIGTWGLRKALSSHVHAHTHEHDNVRHTHFHVHANAASEHVCFWRRRERSETGPPGHDHTPHRHAHGALFVGVLHGLAGTSHLVGILPSLLIPSRLAAAAYIIAFGLGSIAAMTLFSWLMGWLATRLTHAQAAYRRLLIGCSAAAIGVGVFWMYQGLSHAAGA